GHGQAGSGDGPAGPIDEQVTAGEDRRGRGAPAGQGPHPGDQLGEVERFGQIVIGAQVQPFDPVLDQTGGGEHEDTAGAWRVHDLLAEGVTVQPGQVAVENYDVIGVHDHFLEPGRPVVCKLDRDT